jgi:pSer/pThr/pTyr-binding forkhead associated (FHA) protein
MDRASLVIAGPFGTRTVTLAAPRVTLGRKGADVELDDPTVSRLHAFVDEVGGGWILEDLGSRNGTYVNGARLAGPVALHGGDALRLGSCAITFTCDREATPRASTTAPLDRAPNLTPRERDLLVALCRPVLGTSVLSEPASLRTIAAELVITESGVKKLMARVFDRFGLTGQDRRRSRLAIEALRRGAVSPADVADD